MKVEVITTTMNANDFSLYEKMNLQTDAVIANQCKDNKYEEKIIDNHKIKMVSTSTVGVSLNRNIGMTYSKDDILIFSDDDTVFVDGYEDLVLNEFGKDENIEAIKFFAESTNPDRPLSFKKTDALKKAKLKSIMSAGIVVFAIKRKVLLEGNFKFDENLGPGRKIDHGEDGVFIKQLLDAGVNLYVSPVLLAKINQETSSWFKGYDKDFFVASGYIYWMLYKNLSYFAVLRRAYKLSKNKNVKFSFKELAEYMNKGISLSKKVKR